MLVSLPDTKDKLKILILSLTTDEILLVKSALTTKRTPKYLREIFEYYLNLENSVAVEKFGLTDSKLRNAKHYLLNKITLILSKATFDISEDLVRGIELANFNQRRGNARKAFSICLELTTSRISKEEFEFLPRIISALTLALNSLTYQEAENERVTVEGLVRTFQRMKVEYDLQFDFLNFELIPVVRGITQKGKFPIGEINLLHSKHSEIGIPKESLKAITIYHYIQGNIYYYQNRFGESIECLRRVVSQEDSLPERDSFFENLKLKALFLSLALNLKDRNWSEGKEILARLRSKANKNNVDYLGYYLLGTGSILEYQYDTSEFNNLANWFWKDYQFLYLKMKPTDFSNLVYLILKLKVIHQPQANLNPLLELLRLLKASLSIQVYSRLLEVFGFWEKGDFNEAERNSENSLKWLKNNKIDGSFKIAKILFGLFRTLSKKIDEGQKEKEKARVLNEIEAFNHTGLTETYFFDFKTVWNRI